jgi:hypothetical protein
MMIPGGLRFGLPAGNWAALARLSSNGAAFFLFWNYAKGIMQRYKGAREMYGLSRKREMGAAANLEQRSTKDSSAAENACE